MAQKQWMDYDSEMRERLAAMVNMGIPLKTEETWGWRGAGKDGLTRGKVGDKTTKDYSQYEQDEDWKRIAKNLGFTHEKRSMEDINAMIDFVNQGRYGGGSGQKEKPVIQPSNPLPGEPGYTSEPINNYTNGKAGQQVSPQQLYAAEYAAYNGDAIASKVASTGQISTEFYNSAYGQSPEMGTTRFGDADLAGNLSAGITATQLLKFFDGSGSSSLGPGQIKGKGGIYDQVAAMALAETPLELEELPDAGRLPPPIQMTIGPQQIGNQGNAAGVKFKTSEGSKTGRSSGGTTQFNRNSFGKSMKSPLSIGGLTI